MCLQLIKNNNSYLKTVAVNASAYHLLDNTQDNKQNIGKDNYDISLHLRSHSL